MMMMRLAEFRSSEGQHILRLNMKRQAKWNEMNRNGLRMGESRLVISPVSKRSALASSGNALSALNNAKMFKWTEQSSHSPYSASGSAKLGAAKSAAAAAAAPAPMYELKHQKIYYWLLSALRSRRLPASTWWTKLM